MSSFDKAIAVVIRHEGGFVNDAADPGGATKYGISLYLLQHLGHLNGLLDGDLNHDGRVDIEDIKALTPEIASQYYRKLWWDHYGYQRIVDDDLSTKTFDMAVNMGGIQAHRLLQHAICDCGQNISCDGQFGPATLAAVNAADHIALIEALRNQCGGFYKRLVRIKPQLDKFLNGWLVRAAE